jgi:hypothetical protein
VLVGDDEAFLAEAAAIAARELGCRIFAGRAKYELPQHDQQAFDSLPLSARCAATLHLLTDLELLAHTDYFVGAPPPRPPGDSGFCAPARRPGGFCVNWSL